MKTNRPDGKVKTVYVEPEVTRTAKQMIANPNNSTAFVKAVNASAAATLAAILKKLERAKQEAADHTDE